MCIECGNLGKKNVVLTDGIGRCLPKYGLPVIRPTAATLIAIEVTFFILFPFPPTYGVLERKQDLLCNAIKKKV